MWCLAELPGRKSKRGNRMTLGTTIRPDAYFLFLFMTLLIPKGNLMQERSREGCLFGQILLGPECSIKAFGMSAVDMGTMEGHQPRARNRLLLVA